MNFVTNESSPLLLKILNFEQKMKCAEVLPCSKMSGKAGGLLLHLRPFSQSSMGIETTSQQR